MFSGRTISIATAIFLVFLLSSSFVFYRPPSGTAHVDVENPATRFCIHRSLSKQIDVASLRSSVAAATRFWTRGIAQTLQSMLDLNETGGYRDGTGPTGHHVFDVLGPIGPRCRQIDRLGTGDLEKRVCGLQSMIGDQAACHVISVGGNNQWEFEAAVHTRTSCKVHTFDCTVNGTVPQALQDRVFFYKLCLGAKDMPENSKRRFVNWATMLQTAGLDRSPSYVKMDIEGYEFPALRSILDSNRSLLPLQIAMEIHYMTHGHLIDLPMHNRLLTPGEIALFMMELFHTGQYLLLDRNDNPFCQHCSEVLLARFACDSTT
ncbi:methyltransferase domain-containing protein [Hyaloraphidium curvatum]|nr:methyltransferase domain-containing protein [Hyaloraphidium curvatum]